MAFMENLLPNSIEQLSISERLQLVQDIWDSITTAPELVPVSEKQQQELDYRLKLYDRDSTSGSTWEEVKQKFDNLT